MALNLAYKPEEVVSTAGMPESEWLEWRRKGIGGSDSSAVMGRSPFCTARDLYYDKRGIAPTIQEEPNWVTLKVGHLLEPLVAEMLLRIVAVETEHERQPHRVDHPFERIAVAEFRLQVPQVDRKAVRSFKFAIPRFGGQFRRRPPGEDSGDDRIGLVEKGSFHKRVLLFFL